MSEQGSNKGKDTTVSGFLRKFEDGYGDLKAEDIKEAKKEYEELLKYSSQSIPHRPFGIVKTEEISEEDRSACPKLAALLLKCSEQKVTKANNAWIDYLTLLEKKKAAQMLPQNQQTQETQQPNTLEKPAETSSSTPQAEVSAEKVEGGEHTIADDSDKKEVTTAQAPEDVYTKDKTPDNEPDVTQKRPIRQLLDHEKVKVITDLRDEAEKEYGELLKRCQTLPETKEEEKKDEEPEATDGRETIQYLLELPYDKEDVDTDNLHERAEMEYNRLKTSQMYLSTQFRHADYSNCTTCTAKTEEDVPIFLPESTGHGLLRYLKDVTQDKSVFTKRHTEEAMWNEFARLQIDEQHLILARNAVGPDLNKVVIVDRKDFYGMQNELQSKNEEVEELSTRLSRFASNQLTEGNPNIADLSDTHRPTKVGEMFGQLYDDEWSEAFEALKPQEEAGDDDEEIYPDVLIKLQQIVMEAFKFCSKETDSQMNKLQKDIGDAIRFKQSVSESSPEKTQKVEGEKDKNASASSSVEDQPKEEEGGKPDGDKVDQKPEDAAPTEPGKDTTTESQGGKDSGDQKDAQTEQGKEAPKDTQTDTQDDKGKENTQMDQRLKHFLEKQSKEIIKGAAGISGPIAAEEFVKTELPKLVKDKELTDERVINYAKKCVDLCWYMRVQDPPMVLVTLADGDKMNTEEYAYHARKGRVVEVCLWPALFLHQGGPLVAKGHVLPREKGK